MDNHDYFNEIISSREGKEIKETGKEIKET